jgi:hypothetical protein
MKRVDKISRVSVDNKKQRNKPQKTNFHGIFDAIMNTSSNRSGLNASRSQRNKSGLLSRGFMPNKSKGSIGANLGRDRSMGNINARKKKRPLGNRNGNGASQGKFGMGIFGPKRSMPKRRAYFD